MLHQVLRSLAIYECYRFSTALPALDLLIPFFMLIYRYEMVQFGPTLCLRGLECLICISLITVSFYMLVYYLSLLLCIVCVCPLLLLAEFFLF